MMKRWAMILWCVGLMQIPALAQEHVRLGAWNIQWLGSAGKRPGNGHNVQQQAADLADYIKASGVSILGVEEITDNDTNADSHSSLILSDALSLVSGATGAHWTHRLFPKPSGERSQLCGLCWNTDVAILQGEPFEIPVVSTGPDVWKRKPYAVKLSLGENRTDLVLIVLHMKSNLGGSKEEMQVRREEARQLTAHLEAVKAHFNDQDVVMLGDTNMKGSFEDAHALLLSAGFTDLNQRDRPTRGWAPFDRIFVPPAQPEFADAAQRIFGPEFLSRRGIDYLNFKTHFSDHYMVYTDILVMDDDD